MKKSLLAVMVAGMMTASLAAPAAWASESEPETESTGLLGSILEKVQELGNTVQESGVVDTLFGEEGKLKDLLPADVDVNGILNDLQEKLASVDGGLVQEADSLLGMIRDENGKLDPGRIDDMISSLIMGAELESAAAPDYYRDYYEEANEAINRHLLEETADYLEPGDENIISRVTTDVITDPDGTIHVLGYFQVTNYDAEGTDLVMKNYAGMTELMTLTLKEDGTHEVTDSILAEDEQDDAQSVEALCEAIGIDPEDYYEAAAMAGLSDLAETVAFLNQHPEYTRIEYEGELLNEDEMDEKFSELMSELFFPEEEEAEASAEETESTAEEAESTVEEAESTESAAASEAAVSEAESAAA